MSNIQSVASVFLSVCLFTASLNSTPHSSLCTLAQKRHGNIAVERPATEERRRLAEAGTEQQQCV